MRRAVGLIVVFLVLSLPISIAMRRAVGLIVVFLVLSACGNKAALYLPPPERDPKQDSKPAPRQ